MTDEATHDAFAVAEAQLNAESMLGAPALREAAALLEQGRLGAANKVLQGHLQDHPGDAGAHYLLAEAAMRQGRLDAAQENLRRCVDRAPDLAFARFSYAQILLKAERFALALEQAEELLRQQPDNPLFRRFKGLVLEALEDYSAACGVWEELCRAHPYRADLFVHHGHALKALGRQPEAIAAYRTALDIESSNAEAYWSLSALKAFQFSGAEIENMEALLRRVDLSSGDRVRLHFALGQAYGDSAQFEKSFAHYAKGNALHHMSTSRNRDPLNDYVARCRAIFRRDFFERRAGWGAGNASPIFIVGMQRAGSTLVEQILASHSQIEGTKELRDLHAAISEQLRTAMEPGRLGIDPGRLTGLDADAFCAMGERYLERVRVHRTTDRPFFTDKMPANFAYTGLIHLMLPNAKIVDVRRHPMACGFAIFTELFTSGHASASRLPDIGRAYRDYVELMAHFDAVLPGRIHRVFYERLVADPESEIRRLLAYLGLPFEQSCLEFHKTERLVTTRSSEQVRQPIYNTGNERWRHYERWLGPLKAALGDALDSYPVS